MQVGRRALATAAGSVVLAAVAVIGGVARTGWLVAVGLAGLGLVLVLLALDERRRARAVARALERRGTRLRGEVEALAVEIATLREEVGGLRAEVPVSVDAAAERTAVRAETAVHLLEGTLLTEAQALQQLLARYSPTVPLPDVAGWALAPSAILRLVDLVERMPLDLVVECGSGTSTLWISHALRQRGRGRLVSLEHNARFAERTRALLADHGLAEYAEVRHCPLVPRATPHGEQSWYDVDAATLDDVGLLVVDGPPERTGPAARYPALPVLRRSLAPGATVVVDDVQRPDEAAAVRDWLREDPTLTKEWLPVRGVQVLRVVG
ncbi:class I SAM-dependent methyltransferase [Luteimicrobium subarcticum]|uniref:Putative O-methyltransferase YrrM n=1 Tax=Luteimicrobium subarcticum TaxID=620910 RepID=A0A2M8WTP3_9MICO|nr:class I SAM-dependent methyltransferase [Luteimicrobium subarcticum]PJI94254.1 putative O-methyltransferase YrrM [Luteimicrobium subarcticum]